MSDGYTVRNAADPEQVQKADKRERYQADQAHDDLLALIQMPQGRRYFASLLTRLGLSTLIWSRDVSELSRDVGHHESANTILGDIIRVDSTIGAQLLVEAYDAAKAEENKGKKNGRSNTSHD